MNQKLKSFKVEKMNEIRFRFHLAVIKFYVAIMNLLSAKCDEHNIKCEKILEELERYGK